MNIVIREAVEDDFAPIGQLFFETIRTVALADYTPEQVAAWAPSVWSADEWRKRLAGQVVFVAVEQELLVGFISIERTGHIDFLFVHKDRQRQGIASALLGRALDLARQWGLARVFTEASLTARPFFERHGFAVTRPEDVIRHGVTLRRFHMERKL
jgi:putative acetyltransferase